MTLSRSIPFAPPRTLRLLAIAITRVLAFACGLTLVSASSLRAQVATLDNFDDPGATGNPLPLTSWVGQITRSSTSITIGGTARDDNGWGATGRSIDATGMTHVSITAQRHAGHTAPFLVVQLIDATLKSHAISVSSSAFAMDALTTVAVPIGTWPTGFDPARITDWNIGGGTPPTGLAAFRMTFGHLSLTGGASPIAPTITTQPLDRTIGIGTGTTMTVTANGNNSGPLRYQWKKGSAPIPGATLATLSFANVLLSDSGLYQVDVTNDAGTTPSNAARLTVLDARPTHALASGINGYTAGSTVTISNTIIHSGGTGLRWSVTLPEASGWSFVSDDATTASSRPAGGTQSLIEWAWTSIPVSPFTFTYTLAVPIGASGDAVLAALVQFAQPSAEGLIIAKPDPLIVPNALSRHSADTDGNLALSLSELTRVIELYNTRHGTLRTGAYDRATVTTEDGFTPAPTRPDQPATLTRYHSADSGRDGRIDLFELTRAIQLYNTRNGSVRTGRYHVDPNNLEDGFGAGP